MFIVFMEKQNDLRWNCIFLPKMASNGFEPETTRPVFYISDGEDGYDVCIGRGW